MSEATDIARALGSIDARLENIEKGLDKGSGEFKQHDKRIRKIENRQHWYAGAAAAVGAGVTVLLKKSGLL